MSPGAETAQAATEGRPYKSLLGCGCAACSRFSHQCDLSAIATLGQKLVGHHSDQDHRSHYREVERAWNPEQVHKVPQHLN